MRPPGFGFFPRRYVSHHNHRRTNPTHLMQNVGADDLHADVASVIKLVFTVCAIYTKYRDPSILQSFINCIQPGYVAVSHRRILFASHFTNFSVYTVYITYTARMHLHHIHNTVKYISKDYLFCWIFTINVRHAPYSHSSENTDIRPHTTTYQRMYFTFGLFTLKTFHPTAPLL